MFTINIYLRFALIGICLVGGTLLAIYTSFWYALPILLIGIILLIGYFLFGTIQSAAQIMQRGDLEGAEKRLALTFKPNWLFGPNKAILYMVKGTIAIQRRDIEEGEKWLKKAEEINMPSDNEAAMIQVQLASIYASKRKWNQANIHVKKMKDMNITNLEIKAQYKQIHDIVKTKGQSQAKMIRPKGRKGQRFHN